MHNHRVFTYEKDSTFHSDDHHRHDAHEQPQKRRGTSHLNRQIKSRLSSGMPWAMYCAPGRAHQLHAAQHKLESAC